MTLTDEGEIEVEPPQNYKNNDELEIHTLTAEDIKEAKLATSF